MRIVGPKPDPSYQQKRREALEALVAQPDVRTLRPCPDCELVCPCSGSVTCTCACASDCPHAPRALSSDPAAFPVEPGIVPLVYALRCLRLTPPCWSCEGHEDANGKLLKPPQAWFTTRDLAYPDVVAEILADLFIERRLSARWDLCLTHWGERVETGFAIQPRPDAEADIRLSQLRGDVRVIAEALQARAKALAREHIDALG